MGVNQHGLAIGNEAVFSKIPASKEPALLGMDLLRLGLERARTAPEAVAVISALLEEFGQGGNCVQDGHLYYHNSFLIADPLESWVLETVDRHWAAKQVDPLYSISNLLSLESDWDRSSTGLEDFILKKGLGNSSAGISLSSDLSDLIYTTFADGKSRCARSRELLMRDKGEISVQTMISILRDHGDRPDPRPGIGGANICMHASLGPIRGSQSTGSLVTLLEKDNPLVFATGTSAPCTGIFKPFWVDAPLDLGPVPTSRFDPETLYWSHEKLHREVLRNYPERIASYQDERDALEAEFITGALALRGADRKDRKSYSEGCLQKAAEAEGRWLERIRKIPPKSIWFHQAAWKGFNGKASLEIQ
jgi:dipeptidase